MQTAVSVPLLGQIPLDPCICSGENEGKPIALTQLNSIAARTFKQIALAKNQTFIISQIAI